MQKTYFVCISLLLLIKFSNAQEKPGTTLSPKDSLELLQDLITLIDTTDIPVSYAFINVGIGNRLFSIKNNALNAKQNSTNKIILSPSVGYFHKSGFSFSGGANLLKDSAGFDVSQYSITPAFDLAGNKNVDVGLSFTHYFVKDKYSPYASPVQNDLYASFKYKKTWVQPAISFGYSTGEYKEALYKDTIVNGAFRRRYDSATYHLKAFSMMLSAGHQFTWYGMLNDLDGIAFTPTLLLNAGSGKTNVTHKTNILLLNTLIKRGKAPKLQTDKFGMQSLGLNLDLNYAIGDFTLEPQLYMDYYLPDTDSKRFSQVFVFNIGYTF